MHKERREAIKSLLAVKSFVSLTELCGMFPEVSEMTLRRDIEYFEDRNLAVKVRGGCRSTVFTNERTTGAKQTKPCSNLAAKRAISKVAAEYLETGRSIFIDSGSTMRTFTEFVPEKRYSFTTTDPLVALELCRSGVSAVNMVGGRLEGDNRTVTGLQASRFLSDINIDTAILTPTGFSIDNGFTVASFNECELKRIVVSKARCVIMLMDSAKCNKTLPYTFCNVEDTDIIITDTAFPEEYVKEAAKLGTKVIIAD